MSIAEVAREPSCSVEYPTKPLQPLEEDCCGSGCSTCVFDLYDLELSRWQKRCEEIDNGSCEELAEKLISVYEYKKFRLLSIDQDCDNIFYYTFEIPGNRILPLKCGQHLVARCEREDGRHVIRPYTPVSSHTQKGHFEIAVKLYKEGIMSHYMRQWTVGSLVDWRGPFGEFEYKANMCSQLLLCAGGTGITPMLQIIKKILSNKDDDTRVNLLYSVHSVNEILKKSWLDDWSNYWNFNVFYFVTGKEMMCKKMIKYGDQVSYQHIDEDSLNSLKLQLGQHGKLSDQYALICGPLDFNNAVGKIIEEVLKITIENITIIQ